MFEYTLNVVIIKKSKTSLKTAFVLGFKIMLILNVYVFFVFEAFSIEN